MKAYEILRILIGVTILLPLGARDIPASFEDSVHTQQQRKYPSTLAVKPKKYKCVLVDDDDEIGGIAGGVSYVSELQQRRLQAQATSLAEKVPQIGPYRLSTPTLARSPSIRQSKKFLPANSQYGRMNSLPTSKSSEESPALNNKPLKQITLTRPTQTDYLNVGAQDYYQPRTQPRTPINTHPGMKLSKEYCNMIKHYAALYQIKDVLGWVKKNCAFAKTYLPTSTCEEINILVGSCYGFLK